MKWLSKLFTVGANSVNETMINVTESLVDIKREGNALVVKLDKDIANLHERVVEAQTQVQQSKFEIEKNNGGIKRFNEVARLAVKEGDDQDATNALSRVEGLELINNTLQQTVDILQPIIDQQIQHINKMISEKQLLKAEITKLDLEEKAIKMKEHLMGGKVSDKGGIDIQYLRDRVQQARATCEAKEIVNTQVITLESPERPVVSSNVSDRLEALKAEVKGG